MQNLQPEEIKRIQRNATKQKRYLWLVHWSAIIAVLPAGTVIMLFALVEYFARQNGHTATGNLAGVLFAVPAIAGGCFYLITQNLAEGSDTKEKETKLWETPFRCKSCEQFFDLADEWTCGTCGHTNSPKGSQYTNPLIGCRGCGQRQSAVRCPHCQELNVIDAEKLAKEIEPDFPWKGVARYTSDTGGAAKPSSFFDYSEFPDT